MSEAQSVVVEPPAAVLELLGRVFWNMLPLLSGDVHMAPRLEALIDWPKLEVPSDWPERIRAALNAQVPAAPEASGATAG